MATSISERLLAAMHPACSHDLPNQILSLQSLINLLEMDEAARLDGPGREYLQRLKAVADKTAVLVGFLKDTVRLARHTLKFMTVDLGELFRELQAESRSVLTTPLRWELRLEATSVRTDRDLVYPSLGDLVRAIAESSPVAKAVTVASTATERGTRVELTASAVGLDKLAIGFEKRCDVVLARERLAYVGVRMTFAALRRDAVRLLLEFPGPSSIPEPPRGDSP